MARGSSSGGFKVVVAVVFCFSIYSLLHSHLHHDRVHKDFKALAALEARLQSGRFGLGVDSDILPGQQGEESMHRQDGGNEETGRVHQQERPGAEEEAGQDAADGRAGEGGQLETWEDGANKGKAGDGGRPRGDDGPITRESQDESEAAGDESLQLEDRIQEPAGGREKVSANAGATMADRKGAGTGGEGEEDDEEGDPEEEERILKEQVGEPDGGEEEEAVGQAQGDGGSGMDDGPEGTNPPPSAPTLLRKDGQSMEDALAEMDEVLDSEQKRTSAGVGHQTNLVPRPGGQAADSSEKSIGFVERLSKQMANLLLKGRAQDPRPSTGRSAAGRQAAGLKLLGDPAEEDASWPCRLSCRPHGYCHRGVCKCAAAWTGQQCEIARKLPQGLRSEFSGSFLLNQKSVLKAGGIHIVTNPKASDEIQHGRTHTVFAPFEDVKTRSQDRQYRHSGTSREKLRPVITRGQLDLLPSDDFLGGEVIYDTCAVVGNSGLNLVHKDGPEIDGHSAVFRFNSAPTRSSKERYDYTAHVGSNTTFRFVNTQHILFHEGKEWRFQQTQSKTGLFRYLNYKSRHPRSHLAGFDADFTSYVSSNIPTLPTGGYFALMFAIQKCCKVNIWGFHWKPGHSISHHYFDSEVPLKGEEKIHDYAAEHRNLEALAAAGVVELAQPCVAGCPAETGIPCPRCPPGSTCACGDNLPIPVSLPGYCHLRKEYNCMFKCPGGAEQCPGGPKASRCPDSFDPVKHKVRDAFDIAVGSDMAANLTCHSESCRKQRREYKKLAEVAGKDVMPEGRGRRDGGDPGRGQRSSPGDPSYDSERGGHSLEFHQRHKQSSSGGPKNKARRFWQERQRGTRPRTLAGNRERRQ